MDRGRLQGKAAVITGGGRGIDRAVAERYADEDARIAIVSRTASELAHRLAQRVNAVDPGLVATQMTEFTGKRPGRVTEVFVFFASDGSRRVRGRVLKASEYARRLEG